MKLTFVELHDLDTTILPPSSQDGPSLSGERFHGDENFDKGRIRRHLQQCWKMLRGSEDYSGLCMINATQRVRLRAE